MSHPNGGYDQNLLDAAPVATRAQLQEGYNVDLLDEPQQQQPQPRRSHSVHHRAQQSQSHPHPQSHTPPPPLPVPKDSNGAEYPMQPEYLHQDYSRQPLALNPSQEKDVYWAPKPSQPTPQSFWRTRNGVITIALIALVVVGAVVGGAVGGTLSKHTSSTNANASVSSQPATLATTAAVGQQSPNSQPAGSAPTSATSAVDGTSPGAGGATPSPGPATVAYVGGGVDWGGCGAEDTGVGWWAVLEGGYTWWAEGVVLAGASFDHSLTPTYETHGHDPPLPSEYSYQTPSAAALLTPTHRYTTFESATHQSWEDDGDDGGGDDDDVGDADEGGDDDDGDGDDDDDEGDADGGDGGGDDGAEAE
ncbi:hypothetical protein BV22DRAFT_1048848 [Leucogyrophana mollusca]|uniref:Uncharacterized protein n=1 Tax=Leucogyrophana mollusca TaxID=85980 RepID=A0ACB8B9J7_9AGAM|nr:hypothetical protein BV22DRAFT_1048848 [Leucogyrophana mollusca]